MTQTSYYEDTYDKATEHKRGVLLLCTFAVLFLVVLFLWIWHHRPWIFSNDPAPARQKLEWRFPAIAIDAQANQINPVSLGPAIIDWILAALAGALIFAMTRFALPLGPYPLQVGQE